VTHKMANELAVPTLELDRLEADVVELKRRVEALERRL
jgi:ubiquinone biosynthesis protein UbiJ